MSKPLFFVLLLSLTSLPALASEPQVVTLEMDSYSFKPDTITVKTGQPVTLQVKNVATFIPHNIVIKAPDAGLDVKLDMRAGKSGEATFTATKAGTYEMVCDKAPPIGKSHKEKGMHGKLVVE
jgi:plastocyanin